MSFCVICSKVNVLGGEQYILLDSHCRDESLRMLPFLVVHI